MAESIAAFLQRDKIAGETFQRLVSLLPLIETVFPEKNTCAMITIILISTQYCVRYRMILIKKRYYNISFLYESVTPQAHTTAIDDTMLPIIIR